jgi:hypothetical protein
MAWCAVPDARHVKGSEFTATTVHSATAKIPVTRWSGRRIGTPFRKPPVKRKLPLYHNLQNLSPEIGPVVISQAGVAKFDFAKGTSMSSYVPPFDPNAPLPPMPTDPSAGLPDQIPPDGPSIQMPDPFNTPEQPGEPEARTKAAKTPLKYLKSSRSLKTGVIRLPRSPKRATSPRGVMKERVETVPTTETAMELVAVRTSPSAGDIAQAVGAAVTKIISCTVGSLRHEMRMLAQWPSRILTGRNF